MKTYDLKNPYDIDEHFRNYCDMVYHISPSKIPPIQLREIKASFYGAFGMALVCYSELMKKEHGENAEKILEHMIQQVSKHMGTIIFPGHGDN
jgi:hypothetical protein